MGDVVLAGSFPNLLDSYLYGTQATVRAPIIFFTFPEFANLLNANPYIAKIVVIPRFRGLLGIIKFIKHLKSQLVINECDVIFDLQSSLRTRVASCFFSFPIFVYPKGRWKRFLFMLGFKTLGEAPISQVKRYEKFLKYIFFATNQWNWSVPRVSRLDVEESIKKKKQQGPLTFAPILKKSVELPAKFVVFLPSAAHQKKRWPEIYFLKLSSLVFQNTKEKYKIIVLAGAKDDFCAIFDQVPGVINLAGKTNIEESSEILSHASLVVGNDTGLMHIAEALRRPYLTIFGPTSEYFGFIPHTTYGQTISLSLWCRPCSATGSGICYRSDKKCLVNISPDSVWEKIKLYLLDDEELKT